MDGLGRFDFDAINGFSGLNGDTGIGDNGDGTFYVYDDITGETISDGLSFNQANTWGGGLDSGGSGSASGASWWNSGGVNAVVGAGASIFTSIISLFGGNKNNPGNSNTGGGATNVKPTPTILPPVAPAQAGFGVGAIVLTVGVVAGIGVLIWSMNGKPANNPVKKLSNGRA